MTTATEAPALAQRFISYKDQTIGNRRSLRNEIIDSDVVADPDIYLRKGLLGQVSDDFIAITCGSCGRSFGYNIPVQHEREHREAVERAKEHRRRALAGGLDLLNVVLESPLTELDIPEVPLFVESAEALRGVVLKRLANERT